MERENELKEIVDRLDGGICCKTSYEVFNASRKDGVWTLEVALVRREQEGEE